MNKECIELFKRHDAEVREYQEEQHVVLHRRKPNRILPKRSPTKYDTEEYHRDPKIQAEKWSVHQSKIEMDDAPEGHNKTYSI